MRAERRWRALARPHHCCCCEPAPLCTTDTNTHHTQARSRTHAQAGQPTRGKCKAHDPADGNTDRRRRERALCRSIAAAGEQATQRGSGSAAAARSCVAAAHSLLLCSPPPLCAAPRLRRPLLSRLLPRLSLCASPPRSLCSLIRHGGLRRQIAKLPAEQARVQQLHPDRVLPLYQAWYRHRRESGRTRARTSLPLRDAC